MKWLYVLFIITLFGCNKSFEGKYVNQTKGLLEEITFQKEYCNLKYSWYGEIGGKYKIDNDYVYIETNHEIGTLSLKIVNEFILEGIGWSTGNFVKEGYKDEYNKSLLGIYIITSSKLNVREGPGTSNTVLGTMKQGDRVDVIGVINKNWYKVMTGSGEGYVSSKYLQRP